MPSHAFMAFVQNGRTWSWDINFHTFSHNAWIRVHVCCILCETFADLLDRAAGLSHLQGLESRFQLCTLLSCPGNGEVQRWTLEWWCPTWTKGWLLYQVVICKEAWVKCCKIHDTLKDDRHGSLPIKNGSFPLQHFESSRRGTAYCCSRSGLTLSTGIVLGVGWGARQKSDHGKQTAHPNNGYKSKPWDPDGTHSHSWWKCVVIPPVNFTGNWTHPQMIQFPLKACCRRLILPHLATCRLQQEVTGPTASESLHPPKSRCFYPQPSGRKHQQNALANPTHVALVRKCKKNGYIAHSPILSTASTHHVHPFPLWFHGPFSTRGYLAGASPAAAAYNRMLAAAAPGRPKIWHNTPNEWWLLWYIYVFICLFWWVFDGFLWCWSGFWMLVFERQTPGFGNGNCVSPMGGALQLEAEHSHGMACHSLRFENMG